MTPKEKMIEFLKKIDLTEDFLIKNKTTDDQIDLFLIYINEQRGQKQRTWDLHMTRKYKMCLDNNPNKDFILQIFKSSSRYLGMDGKDAKFLSEVSRKAASSRIQDYLYY